jgi:PAS domain S-box-containing protein
MKSQMDQTMRERTRELVAALEQLHSIDQRLSLEVEAAQRLQQVATQLITAQGTQALYEQILDAAHSLLRADFASIQMLYPDRGTDGELVLLSHRGFSPGDEKCWASVNSYSRTVCAEVLRTGRRVVVPDVRKCEFIAGSDQLEAYIAAGIIALQTTPLVSRSGALLGAVSTHWRERHDVSASELRSLDILARLAADSIERSRVEEALRENQQRLASIYDTVRDVIFHVAVEPEGQFRFVSVNPAFLRVTGLNQEMVVGKTVNEVIPEPSLTMILEKYRQAIEKKTAVLWEETSDYPTGRLTGEVGVVPVFDDEGTCTHLVGSVHDITERKRAEAALRESEERLKNAERLAHVGNWHWDMKTNRVSWSEEVYRICGQPPDYTPNFERFLAQITPRDRARVAKEIGEGIATKSGHSIEFQIARPDGELRTIRAVGELLLDESGSPDQHIGACHDITDVRRAQEESFARQKLETVGTLANGIAHDFNNLLGAVLAQAELALEKLRTGSHPEGELDAIRTVAMRGSKIVSQLMIYSGEESEALDLVDVSQIVGEMLQLLMVSVSKHATLETDLGERLPAVRANSAQISQVVMNLVTNASEAIGGRDGTIRLATRQVSVAGRDCVQLEVCDTGCGMPAETQARVFDPFFSTKSPGRGLGLAVVQGIVRGLGGEIQLTSEPGRGATVQIVLPCVEAAAGTLCEPASRISQRSPSSDPITVLLVEDEDLLRKALSMMLSKQGFSVIEARDGSGALDVIRGQHDPIHVLLLDITLPGAPSREVLKEARRVRPGMRVIATSAYAADVTAQSLQGATERFIRKPYKISDLVDSIQDVLS